MTTKILIVEDEVLIGMMLKKKIQEKGYSVCEIVTTGEEALIQAAKHQPDLILMDLCLAGEMNGIESAMQIKSRQNTPVIFFTGNNTDKTLIEQSRKVEPEAIVDKLGPTEELFKALEKASRKIK